MYWMKNRVTQGVGYRDSTGIPRDLPATFVALIIEYAGCSYGHWWYVQIDGTESKRQGAYICLEIRKRMGVERHGRIIWATVDDFETALLAIANKLSPE